MLRSLLITSGSGLVLFEKEWVKEFEKPAKWGGLIRALEEFSSQCVGLPVSYMEFPTVGVTLAVDSKTSLICAVFHDLDGMREVAWLVAQEVLLRFKETYRNKDFSILCVKPNQYLSYGNKLYTCINNTIRTVIAELQTNAAILASLLVFDNTRETIAEGQLNDTLSVLANFHALQTMADEIFDSNNQESCFMSLHMPKKVVMVHRVGSTASLISICKKSVPEENYYYKIQNAVWVLEKILHLLSLYE